MLRKVLAAVAVAVVSMLVASPTALAKNDDNTNEVTYWQNLYGNGTVCYKDDTTKGSEGASSVTLNDGHWSHLIVKGGAEDTGSGPGNVVYDNPKAGVAYSTPKNHGGNIAGLSHWIVCETPAPQVQDTPVQPTNPTIVDMCGTANDAVTLPDGNGTISYKIKDGYVYASLSGNNVTWGDTPSGWTKYGEVLKFKLPKFNTDPCEHQETVCWLMDNYKGGSSNPDAVSGQSSLFPQTRVNCNDPIPCGMWVQKDVYDINTAVKEEIWQNLGDTLEWIKGQPEDAKIYKSHTFIYGGKCKPEQPAAQTGTDKRHTTMCTAPADGTSTTTYYEKSWTRDWTWNASKWKWELGNKVYSNEVVTGTKVVDDATCIPNQPQSLQGKDTRQIQVCNDPANGTATKTSYETPWSQPYVWNSTSHAWVLGAKVFGAETVTGTEVLDDATCVPEQPQGLSGDDVRQAQQCNVPADGTATVTHFSTPWTQDYVWNATSHAWELGAKVYGEEVVAGTEVLPADSCIPAKPETLKGTDPIPPTQQCTKPADGTAMVTSYARDWTQESVWNSTTHAWELGEKVYGDQYVTSEAVIEVGNCNPPTLSGTLVASQCVDDVPWINYDVQLNDPDGTSTDDGTATFTFTAPGTSESFVKVVPIGSGRFLWPGATATDNGDGTFTATGWPGWAFVDDEWVETGNDNYGWTRAGVNVHVAVNPQMDVSLSYPPPSQLCVAGPPTEIHGELDAPPATAVEAQAQYAG